MFNNDGNLKLTDLIDIELLQELQDTFAKTMGVASIAVDDKGPITKPSNFTDFCIKYTRGTEEGYKRCNACDIRWGKVAAESGKPVIYDCHSGLRDFAVPIVVGGKHIASILGGQILTEEPDEEKFRVLARELGIEENEYIDALRKIKIVPTENIDAAANFLYLVANTISKIAHKNLELIKKNERENSQRKIIEKIRSSLDLNETLFFICEETAKLFKVQRASISEFLDPKDYEKHVTRMEFKVDPTMNGLSNLKQLSQISKYYGSQVLKKGEVLAIDNILESDTPDYFKESYNLLGVKSILVIPIQKGEHKWGVLVLSVYDNYKTWTEDEIELAKSIANQIYIAINQAELYEKEKETVQRESLLRRIMETIRSSLDINEIKNLMVAEICKSLNADRCFIVEYKQSERRFLPVENEYLASPNLKSSIGFDLNEDAQEFSEKDKMGEDIIITDIDEYLSENNLYGTTTEKHLRESQMQSGFSVPIFYKNQILGILVIHYMARKGAFSNEEVQLVKTLASQIAIALYQAELYEEAKRHTGREITLRHLIEAIRSTLDFNETKLFIVNETAKALNADRVFLVIFDPETNIPGVLDKYSEYLSSPDLYSLVGYDFSNSEVDFLSNIHKETKPIIVQDAEKFILDNNLQNTAVENWFHRTGMKSGVGTTIFHDKNVYGVLSIHYTKEKVYITDEQINFLRIISDQTGIALYQARLFDREKKTAEREALLRDITEEIRSSLDLDETLSFICEKTAKLFNVQRAAIAQFPNSESFEEFIIKKEYKSSSETRGIAQAENFSKAAAYWGSILMKSGRILAFDNIEESDTPEYFKNTYSLMGVKSMMGTSIRKDRNVWGTLVLSEYNNYRHWTDEEKILLEAIADQVYIAINQAELYETAQIKAQNEKTLREIMLFSVSTFDMKEIIKSIVTEAGKLFKADRCFFIEINLETMSNLPIQDYAEYISSEDIVSHKTWPPSKAETEGFIRQAKQHATSYISDISKADLPEATRKMLENLSVKSYLTAAIFYGDILYGTIVFHYVHEFKQFTQEDVDMAQAIANQSAIVIHQAELYEITKVQAEREKISKNIIEILRSTLDKNIIKRLFVKNIGKFLDADRVIFSEYNNETKIYSPVDKDSEYLSNLDTKSFVGYDWSVPEAQDYVHSLLEKREFHIYNWSEYLQGNFMSQDFINLFESMEAKSSYSFPVIHQQKIMGFFSIQFIKNVRRLMDEDINRIRNICTQAGIAFYHANLYEQAQKSVQTHNEFINKLSTELKDPLYMIIEFSKIETPHELECHDELEHLNNVNNNAKKLLYLLEDTIKQSKIKIDFD